MINDSAPINGDRIDEYVKRIGEVKDEIERRGWFKIRHDEWASPCGDTIRINYAHLVFTIHVNYLLNGADKHVIHVRPSGVAHVPTVHEILSDILNINHATWKPAITTSNGPGGVASATLA